MNKTLITGAIAAALAASAATPALGATTTEPVGPSNLLAGGDWSTADTRRDASTRFEAGPGDAGGSFRMTTPESAHKIQLLTDRYAGTALSALTKLEYRTYRHAALPSSPALPALNLRVDATGDDVADAYLVYEPYQDQGNAAILTGEWQTWDALRGGEAEWWFNTNRYACGQATPCSWSTILARAAEAGETLEIAEKDDFRGSIGINQGSGNTGLDASVDALTIGVGSDETVFDFGPEDATTSTVHGDALAGWAIQDVATATSGFVAGPGAPPAGTGSLRMATGAGAEGAGGRTFLANTDYAGVKVSDLTALTYATYQADTAAADHTAIGINLGVNGVTRIGSTSKFTTLVYEPHYDAGADVATGTWQTWETLGATGRWWCTGNVELPVTGGTCNADTFLPWSTIRANLGGAVINDAGVQVVSGENADGATWRSFEGNVDAITIGVAGGSDTYDLEQTPEPDPGPDPDPDPDPQPQPQPEPQPVDTDGDGMVDVADCAPFNAGAPSKIGTDANCDGTPDEVQQPQPQPQPTPQPQPQSEASSNPPAGTPSGNPTPAPLTEQAQDTLRNTPAVVDEDFDLGAATVFVPTGGDKGEPSRRVPVVDGDSITLDRGAANRGVTQTLMAIGASETDARATVRQTVKIGDREIDLPVQRLTIEAGSSEPVKLPLTRAMRRALRNGQDLELTIAITVIDAQGNRTTETKTFTVKAEQPKKAKANKK